MTNEEGSTLVWFTVLLASLATVAGIGIGVAALLDDTPPPLATRLHAGLDVCADDDLFTATVMAAGRWNDLLPEDHAGITVRHLSECGGEAPEVVPVSVSEPPPTLFGDSDGDAVAITRPASVTDSRPVYCTVHVPNRDELLLDQPDLHPSWADYEELALTHELGHCLLGHEHPGEAAPVRKPDTNTHVLDGTPDGNESVGEWERVALREAAGL